MNRSGSGKMENGGMYANLGGETRLKIGRLDPDWDNRHRVQSWSGRHRACIAGAARWQDPGGRRLYQYWRRDALLPGPVERRWDARRFLPALG